MKNLYIFCLVIAIPLLARSAQTTNLCILEMMRANVKVEVITESDKRATDRAITAQDDDYSNLAQQLDGLATIFPQTLVSPNQKSWIRLSKDDSAQITIESHQLGEHGSLKKAVMDKDWINLEVVELSNTGTHFIFRDNQNNYHLANVTTGETQQFTNTVWFSHSGTKLLEQSDSNLNIYLISEIGIQRIKTYQLPPYVSKRHQPIYIDTQGNNKIVYFGIRRLPEIWQLEEGRIISKPVEAPSADNVISFSRNNSSQPQQPSNDNYEATSVVKEMSSLNFQPKGIVATNGHIFAVQIETSPNKRYQIQEFTPQGNWIRTILVHDEPELIAVNSEGSRLAMLGRDGDLYVYSIGNNETIFHHSMGIHNDHGYNQLRFDDDGNLIIGATAFAELYLIHF